MPFFDQFSKKKPAEIDNTNAQNVVTNSHLEARGNIHIGNKIYHLYGDKKIPSVLAIDIIDTIDRFIGQEAYLSAIKNNLEGNVPLMLVNGEGGIGKTSLAQAFLFLHKQDYTHYAFLYCAEGIIPKILGLAYPLGVDIANIPQLEQLNRIKTALTNLEQPILLLLDNANDKKEIDDFLHLFNGLNAHILITSRCEKVVENEIKITHLPPALAMKLFKHEYNENTPQFNILLDKFLKGVGYNTLCIDMFSKAMVEFEMVGETFETFLQKLAKGGLFLGEENFEIETAYKKNKGLAIATTDDILEALYDISILNDSEKDRLSQLALLPAEYHELMLLQTLFQAENKILFKKELDNLSKKGWLSANKTAYRLSPVLQQILLKKNAENLGRVGEKIVQVLNDKLATDGYFLLNIKTEDAVPFAEIGLSVAENSPKENKRIGLLYDKLFYYYKMIGWLKEAETCAEKSGNISESIGYKNGLTISYFKRGAVYQAQGKMKEAEAFFVKYNELCEELYTNNPQNEELKNSLAISYQKLGDIYKEQEKMTEAEAFFWKYNQLCEELYTNNPQNERWKNSFAVSYEKLGNIYKEQEKMTEAEAFFLKSSQLGEELFAANPQNEGWKHGLAISYEKLGAIYQAQGKMIEAEAFFVKETALFEELYDSNPQNEELKKGLAISYGKLGEIYQVQGKMTEAEVFFVKFSTLMEEVHANNPQNVNLWNGLAVSYYKLGNFYQVMKNETKAKEYFEKAKEIWEVLAVQVSIPKFQRNFSIIQEILAGL